MSDQHAHEHDHSHGDDEHRTPEGDAAKAQQLLDAGDLAAAVELIAGPLTLEPDNRDWCGTLDGIIAKAKETGVDPLTLAPIEGDEVWFGTAAVHAYMLYHLGQKVDGVQLLFNVNAAAVHAPFMRWANEWLDDPALASEVNPSSVVGLLVQLVEQFPGNQAGNPDAAYVIGPVLPVCEKLLAAHPDHPDLPSLHSMMLRKVGEYEKALELAHAAFDKNPTYASCSSIALIHREQGEVEKAIEWFEKSIEYDTDTKAASKLEIADLLLEEQRFAESEEWYRQVLRKEPRHPWARPSLLAVKYMQSESEEDLDKFQRWLEANPDNDRGRFLHNVIFPPVPWVDHLPAPMEASVNLVAQLSQEWDSPEKVPEPLREGGGGVETAITALESPSVYLAWSVFAHSVGIRGALKVTPERVQQPDPRLPKGDVDFVLWKYHDTTPDVAFDQPSAGVGMAAEKLANQRFHLPEWVEQARELVAGLSPDELKMLPGAMVHMPMLPQGAPPWLWVQHVQVAAALMMAVSDPTPLYSVARGPMDWSVDAAVVGLGVVVRENPETRDEITALWREVLAAQPSDAPSVNSHSLVFHLLELGTIDDAERAQLEALKAELENRTSGGDDDEEEQQ